MHEDQAWPQFKDFRATGGLYELTLRGRDGLLWGSLILVAALAGSGTRGAPLSPLELSWWFPVIFFPPAFLFGLWFPSLRSTGLTARLELASRPPQIRQSENLLTPRQERRDLWAFLLVVLLAAATGPVANLPLMLLFSPLIVFRLCSRLWSEVDLLGGRIYYHRTFLGLQITRSGPSLEEAVGIISGVKTDRPGEDPVFSVCAVLPDREPVPLDCLSRTRDESHALGRRLSLQFNLQHETFDCEVDLESLRGRFLRARGHWKPLPLRNAPLFKGGKLPPAGPA